jgi:hypothetical protein
MRFPAYRLGRIGDPEKDIGTLIVYLASPHLLHDRPHPADRRGSRRLALNALDRSERDRKIVQSPFH